MAKKMREFTLVSDLVARTELNVSGGTEGKPDYVPSTDGFIIEVTYASEAQKMGKALSSTIIDVQNILRVFYRANKRFPFQPGKVQKVTGTGVFELPVASQVDRLEAQLKAGQVELADKIRLAISMGLEVPQDWLDQVENEPVLNEQSDDEEDDAMKYPEGSLDKTTIAKLKVLAQEEELEGYDELTASELREELYAIEK